MISDNIQLSDFQEDYYFSSWMILTEFWDPFWKFRNYVGGDCFILVFLPWSVLSPMYIMFLMRKATTLNRITQIPICVIMGESKTWIPLVIKAKPNTRIKKLTTWNFQSSEVLMLKIFHLLRKNGLTRYIILSYLWYIIYIFYRGWSATFGIIWH